MALLSFVCISVAVSCYDMPIETVRQIKVDRQSPCRLYSGGRLFSEQDLLDAAAKQTAPFFDTPPSAWHSGRAMRELCRKTEKRLRMMAPLDALLSTS